MEQGNSSDDDSVGRRTSPDMEVRLDPYCEDCWFRVPRADTATRSNECRFGHLNFK